MQTFINPPRQKWPEILRRPKINNADLRNVVSTILEEVKTHGDSAIKRYCLQFENVILDELKVSQDEIAEAMPLVDNTLKAAIGIAKANIEKFHLSQKEAVKKIETSKGVWCWRRAVAIEKVALYIPGGTAPLFSTLLMLGIPALLAGCRDITVCSPCNAAGKINPVILYVAHLLGLKNIYKIGGVQAIAAVAYGTESVPKAFKIFGPGNQYVTCAKEMVSLEGVAIDMPAGPSEVAVYADESSYPAFIAADLLSQAEHGIDSQVILVTTSALLVDKVKKEIDLQLQNLARRDIAGKALANSSFIVMEKVEEALELLNLYAPEHLIIMSDNAEVLSAEVVNAGSIFLGHYSPESAGDYASGTNHTLPTSGHARAYSGVSLDSFVRKITFQYLSKEGLKNIGGTVECLAGAEGMQAHKNAVSIRLKTYNEGNGI